MLVLLRPLAPLAGSDLPGADRIFGALCWGLRAVAGQAMVETLLTRCAAANPPMLISTGFPWMTFADRRVEFLPRPMLPAAPRAARWLSRLLWEEIVGVGRRAGPRFEPQTAELAGALMLADELTGAARSTRGLWLPKVVTVRRRGRHGPFARPELTFAPKTGWGFVMELRDVDWEDPLRAAIHWTCDTGWGADRSTGRGVAIAEFDENPLPPTSLSALRDPARPQRLVTLSAYHPSPAERDALATAWPATADSTASLGHTEYDLTLRDGLRHPARPLMMVREGSVLPAPVGALSPDGQQPPVVLGSCPAVAEALPGEVPPRRWGFAYPLLVRDA